jgi:hypothetical protein
MLNILDGAANSKRESAPKMTFLTSAEFEKKLRWMIQNPPRDSERFRITPAMAEIMLQWNVRNRPLTDSLVKRYTRLMKGGRWSYTGEPLIFSTERLLDGQHRLAACVASGQAIEALVVFGAPDSAFAFIDVGKTRTAANIFAINGVSNHAIMAAAIQWIVGYEGGGMMSGAATGHVGMDHDALYAEYLKHDGLQDSAWVARAFGRAKIVSPSMMCAIHYICARKNRAMADEFFRKVGEGIGFDGKKDPAYKLHKHLVDAAVSQQRVGRKVAAALTIKAWNAYRLNRDVGVMRFGADETFPRAI